MSIDVPNGRARNPLRPAASPELSTVCGLIDVRLFSRMTMSAGSSLQGQLFSKRSSLRHEFDTCQFKIEVLSCDYASFVGFRDRRKLRPSDYFEYRS